MNIKSLIAGLEKLHSLLLGGQPPDWAPVVAWGIALGFLLKGLLLVACDRPVLIHDLPAGAIWPFLPWAGR